MLRRIKQEDYFEIYWLNKNQLGYDFPIDLTQKKLEKLLNDPTHHFLLGFEEIKTRKIVGYVHAETYDTLYSKSLFNILGLAVSKEFERRGIGRQLMSALEKEATRRELTGIRLNSGMTRKEAHLFYESIGFTSDKAQKRFMKNGLDSAQKTPFSCG